MTIDPSGDVIQLLSVAKRFLDALDDLTDEIAASEENSPLQKALERIHDCRYAVSTAVEAMEEERCSSGV